MSKQPVFIIPGGPALKLDSESGVFIRLDSDEAYLLERYPEIDDVLWRFSVLAGADRASEQWAIKVLDSLRALRKALQDASTPAWKAAALGMMFQQAALTYGQPSTASAMGKANAKRAQPRGADDKLARKVLRYLRRERGLTWNLTLQELENAWENAGTIARVVIERDGERWLFSRKGRDLSRHIEPFTTSTLQRKFSKV